MNIISKKEFIERYADPLLKNDLKKSAIVGYVCSGISAVAGIALMSPAVLIEVAILVGLLIGMHVGKSKACAIIFLCIACLDCLVAVATTGKLSGWLIIVAGIWAVKTFSKIDKQYAEFIRNNAVMQNNMNEQAFDMNR